MVGRCRQWIADYGLIVKPLYELLKTSPPGCLEWDDSIRNAFKQMERILMKAPALGLPDLTKLLNYSFTSDKL